MFNKNCNKNRIENGPKNNISCPSFSQINSNALISFDLREIVVRKGGQGWQQSVDGLHGLVVDDTDWAWAGNTAGVSLRLNPHTQA